MAERDFLQTLADEALHFFEVIGAALERDPATGAPSMFEQALRKDLGLPPGLPGQGGVSFPTARLDAVRAYRDAANPSAEAGMQAIADIAVCLDALIGTVEGFFPDGSFDAGSGAQQLAHSAIDLLATNYVRLRWPRLFLLFQFLSFFEEVTSTYGVGSDRFGDSSAVRIATAFKALGLFLFSPGKALEQIDPSVENPRDYAALIVDFAVRLGAITVGWFDRENERGTENDIAVVRDVLVGWDGPGLDVDSPVTPSAADFVSARMVSVALGGETGTTGSGAAAEGQIALTTTMVPKAEGGTAFFLALGGSAEITQALGRRWKFTVKARSDAGAAILVGGGTDKFRFSGPADAGAFQVSAAFSAHPPARSADDPAPPQVAFAFPSVRGSRIEFGEVGLGLSIDSAGAEVLLTLADCAVLIDPADNDGLVAELLGRTPLRLPFGIVSGLSSRRGFVFEASGLPGQGTSPLAGGGGAAFAATIPLGRAFGPVTVHEVALRVLQGPAEAAPEDRDVLSVEADTSFSATIGPVYLRLDQLGLSAKVDGSLPPEERNLRLIDLDLGVKFPRGVAVNIETSAISGGGTIQHFPDQGLYFGTLDFALKGGTTIQGIGMIATRDPDGSKGFSLLLILTVEFARPWPLGMNFYLEGAGGMIALNHSFDVEATRAALPTGQLRNVLFPADPVHRSAEILKALQRLFPIRRGSHLAGLLAKIGWAEPTLIRMELALLYEWGNQHRLIVLGRVSAVLPRPDEAIIRLNMDAVGLLDFDAGTFALDAVLYDSRLCGRFVLTGAMAMRLAWEGTPGFALAVGGLHPKFRAPSGFPAVARLQLALTQGDNPSLICQAYFAITANTVQFGADCSLHAAAFGFSIQGNVGFDVLIQLLPFHFLAEYRASVQLKRGSRNLFKVTVKGELEGPLPLRLAGKASFEILWCDFSVSFDKTLVDGGTPNDLVPFDAFGALVAALAAPRAWQAQLPDGASQLVTVRPAAGPSGVLLHPLGRLTVRQTVVPLGLTRDIDRVGTATPTGARRFAVTGARIGTVDQTRSPVRDLFAPGQYFDMTDDERLAAPSFESMEAGVEIGEGGYSFAADGAVASPFAYTDIVIGADGTPELQPEPHMQDAAQVLVMTATGAAGRARVRRTLGRRFAAPVRAAAPGLAPGGWAAIEVAAAQPVAAGVTWAEARARAADRSRFVVVPQAELEMS
ncbi:MAG: hypothetical protein KDA73_11405 [Rhodobacteraceae bacterium]|nr:hypothetical protein [Paracoccaceae bacterium]